MANNESGNINASEDIQVENLRRCLKMKKQSKDQLDKRVYRIVLTGGPSGGKTTGQSRLSTFFENLGWKVFRVPETATVLLSGGIKFSDLTEKEIYKFQENLVRTMMQIENTYFQLGKSSTRNCLIICDRGFMDASAYISKDKWEKMMMTNNWHAIEMRDNRYNQVIHLVSAAHGAEEFYSIDGHASRSEDVDLARHLDNKCAEAWVGHPYFDVIDNSTNFETKMNRLIETVCQTVGIHIADRFLPTSRKLLFLVANIPGDGEFPPFQDFEVEHRYLQSSAPHVQVRLRKRGQNNRWSYEQTIIYNPNGHDASRIEVKAQLTKKIYLKLLAQRDKSHAAIYQKRRCFLVNNQYFQLDIFKEINSNPRCKGLILLETYSSQSGEVLLNCLPKFLSIVKEVTGDPDYCMFNLSLK